MKPLFDCFLYYTMGPSCHGHPRKHPLTIVAVIARGVILQREITTILFACHSHQLSQCMTSLNKNHAHLSHASLFQSKTAHMENSVGCICQAFLQSIKKPCSCFGLLHCQKFPEYLFCMNCDHADDMEHSKPNLRVKQFCHTYSVLLLLQIRMFLQM